MDVPREYARWRSALEFDEVSYGVGGIRIVPLELLEEFQVGYSRSPEGKSLCGPVGWWQKDWIVIGQETAMGDPIILDAVTMQVMTARHGEREWNAEPVAVSLAGFGCALKVLRMLAAGRENPVQLDAHPLSNGERQSAFFTIAQNNPDIALLFWELLIGNAIGET